MNIDFIINNLLKHRQKIKDIECSKAECEKKLNNSLFDDEHDIPAIKNAVLDLFEKHWSSQDVFLYCKNLEEVNPYLDEGLAIKRMKDITSKYV